MNSDLYHVKRYLKARTPELLVTQQLRNNIKTGKFHNYQIVFANGTWYAWYNDTAQDLLRQSQEKMMEVNNA
jgi:hypothetical protein